MTPSLKLSYDCFCQMIGDYATAEADVFIPPDQAKPIVESYISLDTSVPGTKYLKKKSA